MGGPGAVVVGTSFGCLTHVRALRAAGFDVIGLVGRDPERTVERARRFDVPRPTTSLSAALEKVAHARAIPVRGGSGLDELPDSAELGDEQA